MTAEEAYQMLLDIPPYERETYARLALDYARRLDMRGRSCGKRERRDLRERAQLFRLTALFVRALDRQPS